MRVANKNLSMPHRIAGGALALALAFFLGYAVDDILPRNERVDIESLREERLAWARFADAECVRSDYYAEVYNRYYDPDGREDPLPEHDRDGDLLEDIWEKSNDLNPEDSGDAGLDPDDDGFTNLDEYRANTNPWYARHYPGVVPIVSEGFDCFYTAEMGLINDDDLLDILIRDPSEGFLPAVRDFVMIEQPDHSFVIEEARFFEIPELTSIQSALWLTELNMDRSRDLALIGLSDFIPNVNDQLIFGHVNFGDLYVIGSDFGIVPRIHKDVDDETHDFFRTLFEWIQNGDYFEDNAPVLATVPEVLDQSWFRDESGNVPRDSEPLSRGSLPADCGVGLVYCLDVVADAGDPERFSANEAIAVDYTGAPYRVGLSDADNDPDEPDLHFLVRVAFSENSYRDVKDYSVFNQDALRLARNELRNVRYSGVMFVPSDESTAIFDALREYLGSSVFFEIRAGGVQGVAPWRVWPYEIDTGRDILAMGAVTYIRQVLDYLSDRYMSRPADLYEH